MLDKSIALGIVGIIAGISTADVSKQTEYILQETTAAAVVVQEHQLRVALELYHLGFGVYPDVKDEAMAHELYAAGYLQEQQVSFDVDYTATSNGQQYRLDVS